MTQITKAYWLAVQRQVAQYKGEVQRELLKAFNEIAGKLNEKELARLVESGGVDRLVSKMLPADEVKAAFSGVSNAVQKTIKRSSENTIKLLPKDARAGTVAFDTLNPNVITAIDNLKSRVIQDLVTNVRETVKSTVRDGLEAGLPAKAIARDIRESIGLAPNQEKAVRNFETMLRTGDSEVLSRELRDHRFDSAIKRAFDNGAKLSDMQVNKMVDIYRQRFVAFHADTVARTATLDATKLGQNITWQSAIDAGTVNETAMLKRWIGVKDDREREEHLEMEGETVAFDDQFSNGEDIPGDSTYNCRCVAFYFQDVTVAKDIARYGGVEEADRGLGIIGTVRSFLEREEGGTVGEIMAQLTTDFPERPAAGMLQTVKIQVSRLAKSTGREIEKQTIDGRGKVFRFKGPAVEIPKTIPTTPEPAPPGLPTKQERALTKLAGLHQLTEEELANTGLDELDAGPNNIKPPFAGNGQHLEMVLSELNSSQALDVYTTAMSNKDEAVIKKITLSSDLRASQGSLDRGIVEKYIKHGAATTQAKPLVVRFNGQDWIIDGHHRLAADLLQGNTTAEVRYIDIDKGTAAVKSGATIQDAASVALKGKAEALVAATNEIIVRAGELPYQKDTRDKAVQTWVKKKLSNRLWTTLTPQERGYLRRNAYTYSEAKLKSTTNGRFFAGQLKRVEMNTARVRQGGEYAFGTLQHETGHLFDWAWGNGNTYWSGTEEARTYRRAIIADIQNNAAVSGERGVSSAMSYDAYVRSVYRGEDSVTREITADLISAVRFDAKSIRSGQWTGQQLRTMFPRASALIEQQLKIGEPQVFR